MIPLRHAAIAALALTLSGALHAAGFIRLPAQPDIALQGGAVDSIPTLGDSFADMAQGAAYAAPPPDPVTPQASPVTPPVTQPAPVPPVQATPVPMTEAIPPVADPQMAALAPATPPGAAPPPPDALAPVPDPQMAAPAQSLRPQPRPDRPALQRVARQPAQATAQTQGNADRNATRGAAAGQEGAAATPQSRAAATAQGDGGTAASASYGRAVLAQISRTRKMRAPSRGRTVVAFSIGEGGALASVAVVQSSGSPELDQVALDHIRRAAPFPQPPAGAQRQFSFEFLGRS
jgi:periplasmic protein TonB